MRTCAPIMLLVTFCTVASSDHGSSDGGSGPSLNRPTAVPLDHNQTSATLRYSHSEFESISDAELVQRGGAASDRHFERIDAIGRYSLEIERGIGENFTLGIAAVYRNVDNYREAHVENAAAPTSFTADLSGFEDIWVSSRYRYGKSASGSSSILGAVRLPTGDSRNRRENHGSVGLGYQPSSGSIDVMVGLAASGGRVSAPMPRSRIPRADRDRSTTRSEID